jgi:hypothetical protein
MKYRTCKYCGRPKYSVANENVRRAKEMVQNK